jgi:dynein heavy chain
LDQGGWYEHKDKEKPFKKIINTILITAMGPPGGGRSFVTPRILRHLSLTSFTSFEDETLNRIFTTILKWFFSSFGFNADVLKSEAKIFSSTLEIYKSAIDQFLPTPTKSHYLFNLRDFARVIFGICMSDKEKLQSQDQAVRIWLH